MGEGTLRGKGHTSLKKCKVGGNGKKGSLTGNGDIEERSRKRKKHHSTDEEGAKRWHFTTPDCLKVQGKGLRFGD